MTVWQIWLSVDRTEGTTCPKNDAVQYDMDGVPMDLLHEFEVAGPMYDHNFVKLAFAYSNKWSHDEGEWPESCRPLWSRAGDPG